MRLSYEDAMKLIHNAERAGSIMGVDTMRELMSHLGNPQDKLKVIHIAGTNGKGSTLAMLSTILTTAGYKVGRYISPTLVAYLERIQIDGEYISENAFAGIIGELADAVEAMKLSASRLPTAFPSIYPWCPEKFFPQLLHYHILYKNLRYSVLHYIYSSLIIICCKLIGKAFLNRLHKK